MRKMLAVAAMLVGAGCAHAWTKPGSTGEEFADDQMKCEMHSQMACSHAYGFGLPICRRGTYDRCMETRGWNQ